MNLLEQILQDPELEAAPPVLIDIGASTHLPEPWRRIAGHSICLAFDPDSRQTGYLEKASSDYRKLLVYPAIVHAEIDGEVDFYLTEHPECSSTLAPDPEKLKIWHFAPFFQVREKVRLRAVTLKTALAETGLSYVDAYKSDTQGTDLRLFRSLPPELAERIFSLEFEPGLMDSYQGEDKLWALLAELDQHPTFVMSRFLVHGSQLLPRRLSAGFAAWQRRLIPTAFSETPGWAEIRYLNRLAGAREYSRRDFLLGWVFAMVENEYGLAALLAERGGARFEGPEWEKMRREAFRRVPWVSRAVKKMIRKMGRIF